MKKTFECQNCGNIWYEGELTREFPDIPDLGQRVSPGERVPAGECNTCHAVVHEILGLFKSGQVVKFIVGEDQLICLNDRGRLSQIGVVNDGNSMDECQEVDVFYIDEESACGILGPEWNYTELINGLSEGELTIDSVGHLYKGKVA